MLPRIPEPTPEQRAYFARFAEAEILRQFESIRSDLDPRPDRYFFLHMLKTAGTTITLGLRTVFPASAIYPNDSDGHTFDDAPQADLFRLFTRWQARHDEIRLIAGHFPLQATQLLTVPFHTFTLLREPVERTLSYLRHWRLLNPDFADTPLEAIYEDPEIFERYVHNHMVKMLTLEPHEMTLGSASVVQFSPDRLHTAEAALRGLDVVGVQEDLASFWTRLGARYGWDLPPLGRHNTTESTPVSDAFRRRIADDNALDMALYETARGLAGQD